MLSVVILFKVLQHYETLDETVARWECEVKFQQTKKLGFLLQNLLSSIGVIGDMSEVVDLRWMNIFVFTGNQHSCHSQQLVILTSDLDSFRITINKVDGDIKSLRHKFELKMNLNQPCN